MLFFNYYFTPLVLLPINEIYAWSNNEKIHIIARSINDIIKSNANQDEAISKIVDYLNKLDETIKEDVFEMLLRWYNDGSLKSQLERKKIIIVGDSYLWGDTLSSPDTANYGAILRNKGFDITSLATSRGGFDIIGTGGTYGAGYTFKTIIEHFVSTLDNPNDVDLFTDVMFLGGVNDSYSSASLATLSTAIQDAVNYVNTTFRNAKCHIGYISQLRRFNSNSYNIGATREIYRTACMNTNLKCCYINNAEYMLKGSELIGADGTHPNELGQRYIANYLTSYLINGNISVHKINTSLNFSLVEDDNCATSGSLTGFVEQSNNIIRMTMIPTPNSPAFGFNNTPNFSFNGATRICLGQIDNMIWGQSPTTDNSNVQFGSTQATIGGVVTFNYDSEGNVVHRSVACPMTITFYDNRVYVCPVLLEDAGHYSTARLEQINLTPFSIILCADDC